METLKGPEGFRTPRPFKDYRVGVSKHQYGNQEAFFEVNKDTLKNDCSS